MFNVSVPGRKASNGDRFDAVVRPHFDALYKAARRMSPSPQDAEDLVQDVCVTAYERLDELECVEYPRAWLLKVMYHRFIDGRRRSSRSPLDIAPSGNESQEPDLYPAGADGPEALVDRDQRVQQVLRAMRCLNAEHCALVAMHDVEGVSIGELCRMTGMPSGTIKAQLHRTRMKLGRLLSNESLAKPQLKIIGGAQ